MDSFDSRNHLPDGAPGLALAVRAVAGDVGQKVGLNELKDKGVHKLGVQELECRGAVHRLHPLEHSGLAVKVLEFVLAQLLRLVEELDRHLLAGWDVLGQLDLRKGALAQLLADGIVSKLGQRPEPTAAAKDRGAHPGGVLLGCHVVRRARRAVRHPPCRALVCRLPGLLPPSPRHHLGGKRILHRLALRGEVILVHVGHGQAEPNSALLLALLDRGGVPHRREPPEGCEGGADPPGSARGCTSHRPFPGGGHSSPLAAEASTRRLGREDASAGGSPPHPPTH
mmetsp:Transcript_9624/g.29138  ORF Transcript_9624/g.29138 Transcript_9624/m.29138 type:complete len:283 (+) Transcript_9624:973-1821(+)